MTPPASRPRRAPAANRALNRRLLAIYLNDHLAGATVGRDLARRTAGSNGEGQLGRFLGELAREIDEDRDTLLALMRRLDVPEDRLKQLAAWGAEKVGRLKLNGRLLGYSPLSQLVELEALTLGVTGKLSLWRALARTALAEPRLVEFDLPGLIARAEAQRDGLERERLAAADRVLTEER